MVRWIRGERLDWLNSGVIVAWLRRRGIPVVSRLSSGVCCCRIPVLDLILCVFKAVNVVVARALFNFLRSVLYYFATATC